MSCLLGKPFRFHHILVKCKVGLAAAPTIFNEEVVYFEGQSIVWVLRVYQELQKSHSVLTHPEPPVWQPQIWLEKKNIRVNQNCFMKFQVSVQIYQNSYGSFHLPVILGSFYLVIKWLLSGISTSELRAEAGADDVL